MKPTYPWTHVGPTCSTPYLLPVVLSLISGYDRVLDVGCGNGSFTAQLAEHGHDVVGVDPSPDGIRIAQAAYPHLRFEILEARGKMLAVLDQEPFDAVVSLEVVEHVYDPLAWAISCRAALRDGGLLVCSTPYHGYMKNLAIALIGGFDKHWDPLFAGGHIKFWSRRTLLNLLERADLVPEKFVGAGRLPYLWKSMVVTARG